MVKNPLAKAGHAGLVPGSGRSPGEEKGNLLKYSCLVGWLQSLGSQKSWTQLSD